MYRLKTSMPYLLNRLGVRMGALFSQRIAPTGITLPMYRTLASLADEGNQKLTDLASVTSIELSTMSRLIGSLVAKGLVTRKRLPDDERTVRINLTGKGTELTTKLMREAQHYDAVLTAVLSPSVVESMKADVTRMYEALDSLERELTEAGKQAAQVAAVLPSRAVKPTRSRSRPTG